MKNDRCNLLFINELNVAWLAGLFEGEGSTLISWKESPNGIKYPSFVMCINMTDEDVLRRVHEMVPGSKFSGPHKQKCERHKDFWRWSVHKREIIHQLIMLMIPHMGERRSEKMYEVLRKMNEYPPRAWFHGSRHGYEKGCRCRDCKDAHAKRFRDMRTNKKFKSFTQTYFDIPYIEKTA